MEELAASIDANVPKLAKARASSTVLRLLDELIQAGDTVRQVPWVEVCCLFLELVLEEAAEGSEA